MPELGLGLGQRGLEAGVEEGDALAAREVVAGGGGTGEPVRAVAPVEGRAVVHEADGRGGVELVNEGFT